MSSDERLDRLIDDVARALTDIRVSEGVERPEHMGISTRRRRRPLWIAAGVGAAAVVALAAAIEWRAPGSSDSAPPPVAIAAPKTPLAPQIREAERPAKLEGKAEGPALRARGPIRAARIGAEEDVPFASDLTPPRLEVAPVTVPAIDVPAEASPAPLDVEPIVVPPIDTRGGSR